MYIKCFWRPRGVSERTPSNPPPPLPTVLLLHHSVAHFMSQPKQLCVWCSYCMALLYINRLTATHKHMHLLWCNTDGGQGKSRARTRIYYRSEFTNSCLLPLLQAGVTVRGAICSCGDSGRRTPNECKCFSWQTHWLLTVLVSFENYMYILHVARNYAVGRGVVIPT